MNGNPLKIALLAPPWFPVPPDAYGGIESVVALLADGLVQAGHEVTLFASGDSRTSATLSAVYDRAPSVWIGNTYHELRHSLSCFGSASDFDVVHDHTGLLGLTLGGIISTPLVHTVHGPVDGEAGAMYDQLCRLLPAPHLISISLNQQRLRPSLPWVANCPNAIDFDAYPFVAERGEYLAFLGRMSPDKGAHRAIQVAQETGLPLKIAAKMREPLEHQYFEERVRPHLSSTIEYLGEVGHDDKVELLRGARATLCPISWEEPFGLVLVESMACGTPVIATRRGSVPEVVDDGVTGVVVETHHDMADALEVASRLDPAEIRSHAERRFRPERMVADYVAAYRTVLAERPARRRAAASLADAGARHEYVGGRRLVRQRDVVLTSVDGDARAPARDDAQRRRLARNGWTRHGSWPAPAELSGARGRWPHESTSPLRPVAADTTRDGPQHDRGGEPERARRAAVGQLDDSAVTRPRK